MNPILWFIAFIGHLGCWCVVFNRTHATSWPRKTRKLCEKLVVAAVLLTTGWFLVRLIQLQTVSFWSVARAGVPEWFYLLVSFWAGVFFVFRWIVRKFRPAPAALVSSSQKTLDIQQELGRNVYHQTLGLWLKKIPFNQSHLLAIESRSLALPRLPPELEGLRICHLSDFHLTGQIDRAWFERVVAEANRFEPDLVLITGDLIDETKCLDWIEPVFGALRSGFGTFFVRGNHDLRIADRELLLNRLTESGMRWIGGKSETIEVNGVRIGLTGNELPWFPGAETLTPDSLQADAFQILLTHTPDQIDWARRFGFDLIFAGHNHGGQVALPVVGPIVAPSKYGVLYAAGTFEIDSAVMHVSRGLSGDECIRINCLPELGCFTLSAKSSAQKS